MEKIIKLIAEELNIKPSQVENTIKSDNKIIESLEDTPIEPKISVEPKQNKEEVSKPKINVDADSIIVNENVITDDEFFDDFFNE